MDTIKAIIVDDEQDAREVLQELISYSGMDVTIVDKCTNVLDAVSSIKKHKPDVVFLDIQMPNYLGYEIVNFFEEINFEIIFVTGYDKYALQAFELSAIDFLVKPINRERLNSSLLRLKEKITDKNSIDKYEVLLKSMNNQKHTEIVIPEISGKKIIALDTIICIQGNGSYTNIHLQNKPKITISKTLKYFQDVLPSNSSFFRSQKSWIINFDHLKFYNTSSGNIEMTDNIIAKLSKNLEADFKEELKARGIVGLKK